MEEKISIFSTFFYLAMLRLFRKAPFYYSCFTICCSFELLFALFWGLIWSGYCPDIGRV